MLSEQPLSNILSEGVSVGESVLFENLKLLHFNLFFRHAENIVDEGLDINVQVIIDLLLNVSTWFITVDVCS